MIDKLFRYTLTFALLGALGVAAYWIGSVLSSDAIGMIIGLLFGILASIPGALLVLLSTLRSRRDAPPACPPAAPPIVIVFGDPSAAPPRRQAIDAPSYRTIGGEEFEDGGEFEDGEGDLEERIETWTKAQAQAKRLPPPRR